jgi:hypothetical protein
MTSRLMLPAFLEVPAVGWWRETNLLPPNCNGMKETASTARAAALRRLQQVEPNPDPGSGIFPRMGSYKLRWGGFW